VVGWGATAVPQPMRVLMIFKRRKREDRMKKVGTLLVVCLVLGFTTSALAEGGLSFFEALLKSGVSWSCTPEGSGSRIAIALEDEYTVAKEMGKLNLEGTPGFVLHQVGETIYLISGTIPCPPPLPSVDAQNPGAHSPEWSGIVNILLILLAGFFALGLLGFAGLFGRRVLA